MAHAIRIAAAPASVQVVANRLHIDVSEGPFSESLPDEHSPPSVIEPMGGGASYQTAVVKFDDGETLDSILQLIAQGTLHGVEWYLIEVHDCNHGREDDDGPCNAWTEFARSGSVPASVV